MPSTYDPSQISVYKQAIAGKSPSEIAALAASNGFTADQVASVTGITADQVTNQYGYDPNAPGGIRATPAPAPTPTPAPTGTLAQAAGNGPTSAWNIQAPALTPTPTSPPTQYSPPPTASTGTLAQAAGNGPTGAWGVQPTTVPTTPTAPVAQPPAVPPPVTVQPSTGNPEYQAAMQAAGKAYASAYGVKASNATELANAYVNRVSAGPITTAEKSQWKNAAYLYGVPDESIPADIKAVPFAMGDGKPGSPSTLALQAYAKSLGYPSIVDSASLTAAYTDYFKKVGRTLTPAETNAWSLAAQLAGIDTTNFDLANNKPKVVNTATGSTAPTAGDQSDPMYVFNQAMYNPTTAYAGQAGTYNAAAVPTGTAFDPTYKAAIGAARPEDTVQGQLDKILKADGPLMQAARNQGTMQAAGRGLANSSLAGGYQMDAMLKSAEPIAQADAATSAAQTKATLDNQLNVDGTLKTNEQQRISALEAARYNNQLTTDATQQNSLVDTQNKGALQAVANQHDFDLLKANQSFSDYTLSKQQTYSEKNAQIAYLNSLGLADKQGYYQLAQTNATAANNLLIANINDKTAREGQQLDFATKMKQITTTESTALKGYATDIEKANIAAANNIATTNIQAATEQYKAQVTADTAAATLYSNSLINMHQLGVQERNTIVSTPMPAATRAVMLQNSQIDEANRTNAFIAKSKGDGNTPTAIARIPDSTGDTANFVPFNLTLDSKTGYLMPNTAESPAVTKPLTAESLAA